MFTLTIVTPEKKLVAGEEIEEVFVPAYRGELNILPGHAPLMTTLRTGVLKYRLKGSTSMNRIAVSWGYCQVNPNGVNVLAETAERPEEIDVARAEKTMKDTETKMLNEVLTSDVLVKYQNKVARARARRDAVATKG